MQILMTFEHGTALVPVVCSTVDIDKTEVMVPRSVIETHVRDNGLPLCELMPVILGRRTSNWHYINSDGEKTDEYSPGHTLHVTLHEEVHLRTVEIPSKVKKNVKNEGATNGTKTRRKR